MVNSNKLDKILSGEAILYVLALLSSLIWITGQEIIGIVVWVILAWLFCSRRSGLRAYLALVAVVIFSVSFEQGDSTFIYHSGFNDVGMPLFGMMIIVGAFSAILAFIVHLIRFKPKAVVGRVDMLVPSIAVILVALIGGLTNSDNSYLGNLMVAGFYLVLLLVVVVFRYIDGDFMQLASTIGVMVGLVVSIETVTFFLRQPDILASIMAKNIIVGWGLSNTMAPVIAIGIFCCGYKFCRSQRVVYLLLMTAMAMCMVATMCRTVIMLCSVLFVAQCVFMVVFSTNKWKPLAYIGVLAVVAVVVGIVYFEQISGVIARILRDGVSDDSRETIRLQMLAFYKQFPIFGSGYGYMDGEMFYPFRPHSTIMSLLGNGGWLATIVFGWYYCRKYCVLAISKPDCYNCFVALVAVLMIGSSCFDHAFLFIYQNIPVLILLEACSRKQQPEAVCKLYSYQSKHRRNSLLALLAVIVVGILLAVLATVIACNTLQGIYILDSYMASYATYFALYFVAAFMTIMPLENIFRLFFTKNSSIVEASVN